MRILIAPIALLAACSPMAGDEHAVSPAHPEDERSYATQVEAPTPDYAELMRAEHYDGEGYVRREATAAPPANARDIGRTWTGRLEAAHALLGAGYDGKGADGAVTSIDVNDPSAGAMVNEHLDAGPSPFDGGQVQWTHLPSISN